MVQMMLILVIFSGGDPASADRVVKALADAGGAHVRVLTGAPALKELEARGVKDIDLVASPDIGAQLTRSAKDVVVVRIENRDSGGDQVIESTVWVHGRTDRHVSIAGKQGDPLEGTMKGVLGLVGPWLPGEQNVASAEAKLPQLMDANDWQGLLDLVSAADPKTARESYYEVMALKRLSRADDAKAAVARMRLAFPNHFLVDAADALVVPEKIQPPGPDSLDDAPIMGPPLPDDDILR